MAIVYLLTVHGRVQGVGYRALVAGSAARYGIRGMVMNLDDGSVEVLAVGEKKSIDAFINEINVDIPGGASVMKIDRKELKESEIVHGKSAGSYLRFSIESIDGE
ncbi:MAG: acylphosphatase [Candidatus Micrarchaeaceae archaeon]